MRLLGSIVFCVVSLTSGAAFAAGKPAEWTAASRDGVVNTAGVSDAGAIKLYITCNANMHSVGFTVDGYRGHALKKTPDVDQPFILEVRPVSGESRKFPVVAYYYDGDDAWVQQGSLTSAFLDAFGQEGRLSLQSGKGIEIGSWTLKGTSKARDMIQKVCNL